MKSGRFSKLALGCALAGTLFAATATAKTRPLNYDDCQKAAVESYLKLLFPNASDTHVTAFGDEVEGARIPLTATNITPHGMEIPVTARSVFQHDFYIGDVWEEGLDPKIFLFGVNHDSDIAKADAKYIAIYDAVRKLPADRLRSVESGPCSVYAEHDKGDIKRAVVVVHMDNAAWDAHSGEVSIEAGNAAYAKYVYPAELCLTKTAIALNGGWGLFQTPDVDFAATSPGQVRIRLDKCVTTIWARNVRPGMTQAEARVALTTVEVED